MSNPGRTLTALLCFAASLIGYASTAQADTAHLRNGRSIAVSGVRPDGERTVLLLEGGGELTLPSGQVLSIEPGAPAPEPRPAEPIETGSPAAADPVATRSATAPARVNIKTLASRIARKYAVEERLVLAVIEVESRFDSRAVSPRGALGLMQLMPQTAERFAVAHPFDPGENIEGGVRYLKELLDRYSGQKRLALAAYNAGEEAVERFSGIPPFRETIRYVDRVLRALQR